MIAMQVRNKNVIDFAVIDAVLSQLVLCACLRRNQSKKTAQVH